MNIYEWRQPKGWRDMAVDPTGHYFRRRADQIIVQLVRISLSGVYSVYSTTEGSTDAVKGADEFHRRYRHFNMRAARARMVA